MGLPSRPASFKSAWMPTKSVWSREASPQETMVRFSPSIRMTSAMVPMAASVQYRANRAFSRSGPPSASTSFSATPTPAKYLKGYGQSLRWGSTTATARGSSSLHSWWSVMTTSMPIEAAKSTSSLPVMPQSTVIINVAPCSRKPAMASRDSPYPSSMRRGI